MSRLPAIPYLRFILENDYLIAFAVAFNRGHNPRAVHIRFADCYLIAVGNQQHFIQFNCAAFFRCHPVNFYRLALGYFILFAL